MTTFTGKQAGKLIELFADTPSEQVQALVASGLLTDLRDGNIEQVNREEFRRMLGLKPLNPPIDPLATFFKTRTGLWVSGEFTNRILLPALEMDETAPASVGGPYDLPKDMTDSEILAKIDHKVFKNSRALLTTLARLIDEQWGGKEGDLLANGYANLSYVRGRNEKGESEVFAVFVDWDAGDDEWDVFAFRLGGRTWGGGSRAFPSN